MCRPALAPDELAEEIGHQLAVGWSPRFRRFPAHLDGAGNVPAQRGTRDDGTFVRAHRAAAVGQRRSLQRGLISGKQLAGQVLVEKYLVHLH